MANVDVDDSGVVQDSNIVTITEDEPETVDNVAVDDAVQRKAIFTILPLSRIKKICKLDPDVHMITSDSVKLVTFCAERFVECLTKEALRISKEDGRKTIQMKDIERAIKRNPLFHFLEDALADWPDFKAVSDNEDALAADEVEDHDHDENADILEEDDEEMELDDTTENASEKDLLFENTSPQVSTSKDIEDM